MHIEESKNKRSITYPNLDSALRSVPHSFEISIPQPPSSLDEYPSEFDDVVTLPPQGESSSDFSLVEDERPQLGLPQLFSQSELTDLIRDLRFFKRCSRTVVRFQIKKSNLLSSDTSFS